MKEEGSEEQKRKDGIELEGEENEKRVKEALIIWTKQPLKTKCYNVT